MVSFSIFFILGPYFGGIVFITLKLLDFGKTLNRFAGIRNVLLFFKSIKKYQAVYLKTISLTKRCTDEGVSLKTGFNAPINLKITLECLRW